MTTTKANGLGNEDLSRLLEDRVETEFIIMHDLELKSALIAVDLLSSQSGFDYVVTPNIDHISRLLECDKDSELRKVYENASLSLCDSRILQKMLKFKGITIKEVVPGSTLTLKLFESDILTDRKVSIIGGEESVISKLKSIYPNIVLDHYNPPMGFINKPEEVEKTLLHCEKAQSDIYFLAVGSPRQELLAFRMKSRLNKGVALCVGASILFLVGEEKRAPSWVQKAHMEWCYRMLQNPKVLAKRYFGNFLTLPKVFKAL